MVEERLRKKMDKPKEVFRKAVSNVMNLGHLDCNKSSLYAICTCVLKSLHTLVRYGDGSIYQLLTSILELKMSNKLRQEWACANGKSDAVPDIRDLIQFAEERHSLLDDTSTYSRPLVPYRQPYPTQKPSKPYNSQHKTPRANLLPIRAATPTCPVCKEEHPVYYCSQFKSWDVDQRKGMIKRKYLCYNCLATGHQTSTCPSRKSCRTCGGKHHTLIHVESTTSASTSTSDSVEVSDATSIIR